LEVLNNENINDTKIKKVLEHMDSFYRHISTINAYDVYYNLISLKLIQKTGKKFPKDSYLKKIANGLKNQITYSNYGIFDRRSYELIKDCYQNFLDMYKKNNKLLKPIISRIFLYYNLAQIDYKLGDFLNSYNNFVLSIKNKNDDKNFKKYNFKNFDYLKKIFLVDNEKILSEKTYYFSILYGKNLEEYKKLMIVLRVLRNTIFALHGYKFKNKDLKEYFENKSWYKPVENFNPKEFNEIEKRNINYFKEFEKIVKSENDVKKLEEKLKAFQEKWKGKDNETEN